MENQKINKCDIILVFAIYSTLHILKKVKGTISIPNYVLFASEFSVRFKSIELL